MDGINPNGAVMCCITCISKKALKATAAVLCACAALACLTSAITTLPAAAISCATMTTVFPTAGVDFLISCGMGVVAALAACYFGKGAVCSFS